MAALSELSKMMTGFYLRSFFLGQWKSLAVFVVCVCISLTLFSSDNLKKELMSLVRLNQRNDVNSENLKDDLPRITKKVYYGFSKKMWSKTSNTIFYI